MTALALLVIALHVANTIGAYFWVTRRLEAQDREVQDKLNSGKAPLLAPDPRVDELMRIVGTLRGVDAIKQSFGMKS